MTKKQLYIFRGLFFFSNLLRTKEKHVKY